MNINPRMLLLFLERLRWRLVRIALLLALSTVAGYYAAPRALSALLIQGGGLEGLVFLSPAEAFTSRLKLALALGILVALPLVVWQVCSTFTPMLSRSDRRALYVSLPFIYLLFIGGVAFAYLGVLPLALKFFLGFANDNLQPVISVGNFIAFAIWFALPFGLVFELPVVILLLARLGIVTPAWLAHNRKYAILVIFIVAAIITPADVFSQVSLAVPMLVLYEISLILARIMKKKRAPHDSAETLETHTEDANEPSEEKTGA